MVEAEAEMIAVAQGPGQFLKFYPVFHWQDFRVAGTIKGIFLPYYRNICERSIVEAIAARSPTSDISEIWGFIACLLSTPRRLYSN